MDNKRTLIIAANYSAAREHARKENIRNWEYVDYPDKLRGISSKDFHCISLYGWWGNPAAEEWNRWTEETRGNNGY